MYLEKSYNCLNVTTHKLSYILYVNCYIFEIIKYYLLKKSLSIVFIQTNERINGKF